MKYSVIIPVYNAERTLRRCLDSLLPQLNNDIEVLLINDGSMDKSGAICQEYAENNLSIRLFEQENSGVSVARNRGLDNANGEYVLFIDSDDYVDSNYFSCINDCIKKEETDLLIFGALFQNRNQNNKMEYKNCNYYDLDAVKLYAVLSKKQHMYSLWNKAFLRHIIENNSIRFSPGISIGEDGAFIFKYILHTNRLTSINSILYYVDERNMESLSRKKRDDLCDSLIESYNSMHTELNRVYLDEESTCIYNEMLSRAFYRSAYSCFSEVISYSYDRKTRRTELLRICTAYQNAKIQPYGRDAIILSLPVRFNMIPVIKLLFFLIEKI